MFKILQKDKPSIRPTSPSDHWSVVLDDKENRGRSTSIETSLAAAKQTPWAQPPPGKASLAPRPRSPSVPRVAVRPIPGLDFETRAMNRAFEQMLDELQVPQSLRPKLLAMEKSVKESMLKSSHILEVEPTVPPHEPPSLRKSRSGSFVAESRSSHGRSKSVHPPPFAETHSSGSSSGSVLPEGVSPWLNAELASSTSSLPRPTSPFTLLPNASSISISHRPGKDRASNREKEKEKELSPAKFVSVLKNSTCTELDVEKLKKLRLMLRNETAGWTELYIREGGYSTLLEKLMDLLHLEWREEQRDDKILHEILRCFKALSTSSIGCFALRTSCPSPFQDLVTLLYSDKKPGDIASRQLIVDLLLILFELYPSNVSASIRRNNVLNETPKRSSWTNTSSTSSSQSRHPRRSPSTPTPFPIPPPYSSLFNLVQSLLLTKAPPRVEQPGVPITPHEFIESLHVPRIYKTYLQELGDICRDYFWVFCHPHNAIWSLAHTDEEKVEKPRAPGGMTGGVEYEAAAYMTSHFRLINSLARTVAELDLPPTDEASAYKFHNDLFASGIERIIAITRRASTSYYPTLHLELARYIALATNAKYPLPYTISRLISMPPVELLKATETQGTTLCSNITISEPRPSSRLARSVQGPSAVLAQVKLTAPMMH